MVPHGRKQQISEAPSFWIISSKELFYQDSNRCTNALLSCFKGRQGVLTKALPLILFCITWVALRATSPSAGEQKQCGSGTGCSPSPLTLQGSCSMAAGWWQRLTPAVQFGYSGPNADRNSLTHLCGSKYQPVSIPFSFKSFRTNNMSTMYLCLAKL